MSWISKLDVIRQYFALRKEQWSDSYPDILQERLGQALSAAAATPYYKDMVDLNRHPPDLRSFPPVSKEQIQKDPQAFINPSYKSSDLYSKRTSGSTFKPLSIYFDYKSNYRFIALSLLSQVEAGFAPTDLLVSIWHGKRKRTPIHERLGLFRNVLLSAFDDEHRNYESIRNLRPEILWANPSALHILANINSRSSNPISMKRIFSMGELLDPDLRSRIESSFNAPMFDFYGTMEFGIVARQCPEERSYHVNPSCHLEIMDGRGRPKKGGSGEIAITGLFNLAMPLVRYRMEDIGSLGKDCPCGRALPVLKKLQGRSGDMIVLPSGRVRSPLSMGISRLKALTKVKQAQMVQESPDHFILRYVPLAKPMTKKESDEVTARMRECCLGEEISVEYEKVERIEKGRTGKMQFFISKVRPPRQPLELN